MIVRALCLMLLGMLTGCGQIGNFVQGEDNSVPPAELVDFDDQLTIKTLWSRSVGADIEDQYVKLRPSVSDGFVYAADLKGDVSAYDGATGKRVWETDTDITITGGTGSGDGLVLVGGQDGEVIAISADSGEILWQVRVSSEVLAAPQVAEGIVVVRTGDARLFGLDAQSGARLWVYDRTIPILTLRGTSAPILVNGMAIVGFDSGRLVAVEIASGQLLWEARIAIPSGRSELERLVDIDSEPRVYENSVYVVTFQGRTAALELNTGQIIWQRDMSSHAGLGVDQGLVFVTDEDSLVWALDRHNSASMWRQSDLKARQLTAPVSFKDYVVVGDFEGYLHWMAKDDGRFVGRIQVDSDGIIAAPVVDGDTLFVYGKGGSLAALRVE